MAWNQEKQLEIIAESERENLTMTYDPILLTEMSHPCDYGHVCDCGLAEGHDEYCSGYCHNCGEPV